MHEQRRTSERAGSLSLLRWLRPAHRAPQIWPSFFFGLFLIFVVIRLQQTTPLPDRQLNEATGNFDLPSRTAKGVRVVDGDTLVVDDGERIRLLGINTPEIGSATRAPEWLGEEAATAISRYVHGQPVRLEFDRERLDKYGRTLAYVYVGDLFVNEQMILDGYSAAHNQYPFRSDMKRRFTEAEKTAKLAKRGLWQEIKPPQ